MAATLTDKDNSLNNNKLMAVSPETGLTMASKPPPIDDPPKEQERKEAEEFTILSKDASWNQGSTETPYHYTEKACHVSTNEAQQMGLQIWVSTLSKTEKLDLAAALQNYAKIPKSDQRMFAAGARDYLEKQKVQQRSKEAQKACQSSMECVEELNNIDLNIIQKSLRLKITQGIQQFDKVLNALEISHKEKLVKLKPFLEENKRKIGQMHQKTTEQKSLEIERTSIEASIKRIRERKSELENALKQNLKKETKIAKQKRKKGKALKNAKQHNVRKDEGVNIRNDEDGFNNQATNDACLMLDREEESLRILELSRSSDAPIVGKTAVPCPVPDPKKAPNPNPAKEAEPVVLANLDKRVAHRPAAKPRTANIDRVFASRPPVALNKGSVPKLPADKGSALKSPAIQQLATVTKPVDLAKQQFQQPKQQRKQSSPPAPIPKVKFVPKSVAKPAAKSAVKLVIREEQNHLVPTSSLTTVTANTPTPVSTVVRPASSPASVTTTSEIVIHRTTSSEPTPAATVSDTTPMATASESIPRITTSAPATITIASKLNPAAATFTPSATLPAAATLPVLVTSITPTAVPAHLTPAAGIPTPKAAPFVPSAVEIPSDVEQKQAAVKPMLQQGLVEGTLENILVNDELKMRVLIAQIERLQSQILAPTSGIEISNIEDLINQAFLLLSQCPSYLDKVQSLTKSFENIKEFYLIINSGIAIQSFSPTSATPTSDQFPNSALSQHSPPMPFVPGFASGYGPGPTGQAQALHWAQYPMSPSPAGGFGYPGPASQFRPMAQPAFAPRPAPAPMPLHYQHQQGPYSNYGQPIPHDRQQPVYNGYAQRNLPPRPINLPPRR